ncbi:MAG: hypothetical protein U0871_28210 [Gemmataceae bacterium]
MKIAYLNRWSDFYHLMLAEQVGDTHRRVESRFVPSLAQARTLLARWQCDHAIEPQNVLDNSRVDLDDLIGWMDMDFASVAESEVVGVIR